jgi:hypothetical protein
MKYLDPKNASKKTNVHVVLISDKTISENATKETKVY